MTPGVDRANPSIMVLTSADFEGNGTMPRELTCQGGDHSPALEWSGAPPDTKSFALIVDDPDAPDPNHPKMTWVHWVVFNLPPTARLLRRGDSKRLPEGAGVGVNDWNRAEYGGPCPPIGRHRYLHKLYALDTLLALTRPTKQQLERAMKGHVLAVAQLVGLYEKAPVRGDGASSDSE